MEGRKTGGRAKGTRNKVGQDLREIAGVYTMEAISTLAEIMRHSPAEPARVAAARELLDRAHGKASQAVTGAEGGALAVVMQIVTGVARADD